jgi:hypothetical protein
VSGAASAALERRNLTGNYDIIQQVDKNRYIPGDIGYRDVVCTE